MNSKKMHYSIIVIGLCALFQFYKYILQVYPSIITDQLMSVFHINGLGLGILAAGFYYTFILTQLFVGILLDRFGARFVAGMAILTCAIGILLFPLMHTIEGALICRGLMGIGVAFSTVTYMKMATDVFPLKFQPFVSGLLATATMAGAVFGEVPLCHFMIKFGWQPCLTSVGIAGVILAISFVYLVKNTNNHQRAAITRKDFFSVFMNKQNWLLTLFAGLAFSPISIFAGLWGNPFLQSAYHFDKTTAAYLISFIFLGLGLGSPFIGLIASIFKDKCLIMFYCMLLACASLSFIIFNTNLSEFHLMICFFIFGFCVGGFMLAFNIGKAFNSPLLTATVIAMINSGDALITAIAEPLIGKLLDVFWTGDMMNGAHQFSANNYQHALSLLPAFLALAAVVIYIVKLQSVRVASNPPYRKLIEQIS